MTCSDMAAWRQERQSDTQPRASGGGGVHLAVDPTRRPAAGVTLEIVSTRGLLKATEFLIPPHIVFLI